MESRPLISVIIPAYNAAAYLEQCIETMLSQTYKNLEIIVIDDGSTDNTSEIAKRYRVKLIQQTNQGVSVARNAGLAAASGEYLHFMDVDDFINLNFYERMLAAIIPENADMALTGYVHERLPGFTALVSEKFLYVSNEDKLIFTNVFRQGQVWKYLFRTSFLKERKLTFDPQLRTSQDKIFSFQAVIFSNKIVTAPGTLYFYKERGNSLRTTSSKEKTKQRNESIQRADSFCEDFARQHQIKTFRNPLYVTYRYKFLGFLKIKKQIFYTGRVKWYVFGVCILNRRQLHEA